MKKEIKIIFHIDLNAFYASCAIIEEPYLKDKVFVVGGRSSSNRGVVSTASYKARAYGIHSAMNINEAYERYPRLVIVPTDFALYNKFSNHFFSFLKTYSSLILAGSIDEAYVDMTERSKKQHPLDIAKERFKKDRFLDINYRVRSVLPDAFSREDGIGHEKAFGYYRFEEKGHC